MKSTLELYDDRELSLVQINSGSNCKMRNYTTGYTKLHQITRKMFEIIPPDTHHTVHIEHRTHLLFVTAKRFHERSNHKSEYNIHPLPG